MARPLNLEASEDWSENLEGVFVWNSLSEQELALTADLPFEQAGYRDLLRENVRCV